VRFRSRTPNDAYASAITQLLSYALALVVATAALLGRSVCHPEPFCRLPSLVVRYLTMSEVVKFHYGLV
jgi:hypothetical protein